jgi:DUF971 family protein
MAILDPITPTHYKVRKMQVRVEDGEMYINYAVEILNTDGHSLGLLYPNSAMTEAEKAAVLNRYNSDKAAFEAATGLTEWTNP